MKRLIHIEGNIAFVPLGGEKGSGKFALIDLDFAEVVGQFNWHLNKGYAATNSPSHFFGPKRTAMLMHHFVVGKPIDGLEVDHINCNKLDNRAENLRICNRAQNQRNRSFNKNNKFELKGVVYREKMDRYQAGIRVDGKFIYLGVYKDPLDAAKAYDEAAILHHQEFFQGNQRLY